MAYERNSDCWYLDVCDNDCKSCIRYSEMKYLMDNSGIPKNRQSPRELTAGTADYDIFCSLAEIKSNIVDFVNNGRNIFITSSNTGNGKTSWAIKLLTKYFDSIWAGNGFRVRGMFIHTPTLLLQLKNFSDPLSETYKKNLLNCDLVVFDDIADTSVSAYDYSNLLMIIDYRIQNEKSCIYTSNRTTKKQLEEAVGVRIASRIWETSFIAVLKGKDRRNGSLTNYQ